MALKIKRQLQLPFIYLLLKLSVFFYDFFIYPNGRWEESRRPKLAMAIHLFIFNEETRMEMER